MFPTGRGNQLAKRCLNRRFRTRSNRHVRTRISNQTSRLRRRQGSDSVDGEHNVTLPEHGAVQWTVIDNLGNVHAITSRTAPAKAYTELSGGRLGARHGHDRWSGKGFSEDGHGGKACHVAQSLLRCQRW